VLCGNTRILSLVHSPSPMAANVAQIPPFFLMRSRAARIASTSTPCGGRPTQKAVRLRHRLRDCLFLLFMPWVTASAQVADSGRVVIAGDTSGVPPSCRTSTVIAAINNWFRAVETGDTSLIAAGVSRRFRWISVSPFSRSEPEFTGYQWSDLGAYVERQGRVRVW
jgi:hypothetical protein